MSNERPGKRIPTERDTGRQVFVRNSPHWRWRGPFTLKRVDYDEEFPFEIVSNEHWGSAVLTENEEQRVSSEAMAQLEELFTNLKNDPTAWKEWELYGLDNQWTRVESPSQLLALLIHEPTYVRRRSVKHIFRRLRSFDCGQCGHHWTMFEEQITAHGVTCPSCHYIAPMEKYSDGSLEAN